MAKIDIKRRGDGTVEFVPSLQQVDVGEGIFWRNLDPRAQHWITLQGKDKDFWFGSALAPFVDGQSADTTSEIVFRTADDAGNPIDLESVYVYVCFLHEHDEQGKITLRRDNV
jgi:plastocyanin